MAPSAPHRHASFGTVPTYLRRRQDAAAGSRAADAAVAADIAAAPPGMRRVPAAERADMLRMLAAGLESTRAELAAFRLVVSAPRALRRCDELRARELALEDALAVFSKDLVFVKRAG